MLLLNDFAPAIIRQENRYYYFLYLNKSQLEEDHSLLEEFICDAILNGYNLALKHELLYYQPQI